LIEGQTAFSLLEKEVDSTPIITFNQAIDDMLGGGVACGKLTEFCGVPGIGKTQMGYVTKTYSLRGSC
jgi:RAD51-like protein 2